MAIRPRARRVWRYWRNERRTLLQGFVALFISSGGDLLAGLALSFMDTQLRLLPGLIILIPAAIGMRGNIFGALGSRLGTGIHAGLFEASTRRSGFLGQNVRAAWSLTLATCLYLGLAAHVVATAFTGRSLSVASFVTISILGGVLGSGLVGAATVGIAVLSERRRWDLDSVSAPLVTAFGDIATLPALWVAALAVQHFPSIALPVALIAGALCLIETVRGLASDLPLMRRIVRESIAVLLVAGTVDLLAGVIVDVRLERFLTLPALLILVPPFLEDTNALSGILASRLGSKLHLGLIEPNVVPDRLAWADISINFLFAISVFLMVGISSNLVAVLTHRSGPGLATMVAISLLAGLMATVLSSALAYGVAVATFRFGWDPDNHSIPISSAVMDLAGTLCLVLVILLLGVSAHG
jgi:mgtE-like transporter